MPQAAAAGGPPGTALPSGPGPSGTALGGAAPPSRRDRLRAATTQEIIDTARRLLVASGPQAMTLRAIAREMGMTAPGLYRYFGSFEELLSHVCASVFTELQQDISRAIEAPGRPPGPGQDTVAALLTVKMIAACREFRRWSLGHQAEFSLLFGVPLPGLDDGRYSVAEECALAFAATFYELFVELWHTQPFPVPGPGQIDPALASQLTRYRDALSTDLRPAPC